MRCLVSTLCFVVMLALTSCVTSSKKTPVEQASLSHAKGFSIYQYPTYKEVVVWNPWVEGKVYARYYLVSSDTVVLPHKDGCRIRVPLNKVAYSSSTHVAFVNQLFQQHTIKGVCSPHLIYDESIRQGAASQQIADLGDALQLNIEATLHLHPEVFFAVGYNSADNNIEQLKKTHIPVVYTIEWMETSLLARAEWIKFMAAFFDQEALADSIFEEVENKYRQLTALTDSLALKPSIMSGGNFRGTWYMPAGNSYMGQLFKDAGAAYHYAENTQSGSLPLTIEQVMAHFSNADIWVGSSATTLQELAQMDHKHALFKAYTTQQVYNFNKRTTPEGANDFWELGLARPDLLLADLMAILHPYLLPEHELIFINQVR